MSEDFDVGNKNINQRSQFMPSRRSKHVDPIPLEALPNPELVFGVVGAIGTDIDEVTTVLVDELSRVGYEAHLIHVSRLMYKIDRYRGLEKRRFSSEYDRIDAHMTAGSGLRKAVQRGDALALMCVAEIRRIRGLASHPNSPNSEKRVAYILRSLKNPEEVRRLRDIYGRAFYVISAYAPREVRISQLALRITTASGTGQENARAKAEQLVERDEKEEVSFGQNVRESFPLADTFVDASVRSSLEESLRRFVELVFSHPFHTPTRDEYGMFHAYGAALRSADLSRQVGAAITTKSGDIIAVGCNDVPRFSGGQYWPEDAQDHRDFRLGHDSNTAFKRELVEQFIAVVDSLGFLSRKAKDAGIHSTASKLLSNKDFKDSIAASVIEFGRSVHAEMAAISDAARRGVSLAGTTLFSTTFPCHLCARHIVASGVSRVVYIEPYPKSRAARLYADSIVVDPAELIDGKVAFKPFVGLAPSVYTEMFRMQGDTRKRGDGKALKWAPERAVPRMRRFVLSYISIEQQVVGILLPKVLRSANMRLIS
jgi:deoxycytidylate deaminase